MSFYDEIPDIDSEIQDEFANRTTGVWTVKLTSVSKTVNVIFQPLATRIEDDLEGSNLARQAHITVWKDAAGIANPAELDTWVFNSETWVMDEIIREDDFYTELIAVIDETKEDASSILRGL